MTYLLDVLIVVTPIALMRLWVAADTWLAEVDDA